MLALASHDTSGPINGPVALLRPRRAYRCHSFLVLVQLLVSCYTNTGTKVMWHLYIMLSTWQMQWCHWQHCWHHVTGKTIFINFLAHTYPYTCHGKDCMLCSNQQLSIKTNQYGCQIDNTSHSDKILSAYTKIHLHVRCEASGWNYINMTKKQIWLPNWEYVLPRKAL